VIEQGDSPNLAKASPLSSQLEIGSQTFKADGRPFLFTHDLVANRPDFPHHIMTLAGVASVVVVSDIAVRTEGRCVERVSSR
jgi:hypothetical protein